MGELKDISDAWTYLDSVTPNEAVVSSAPGFFFRGLAHAGLFKKGLLPQDDQVAIQYLHKAQRLDPSNSAPSLFIGVIEKRLGTVDKAKIEIMKAAKSSNRFDTYIPLVSKTIAHSVRSPEDVYSALTIISKMDHPDTLPILTLFKEAEFEPYAIIFGKQMMAQSIKAGKDDDDPINFIESEYKLGRALVKIQDPTQGAQLPDLEELREKAGLPEKTYLWNEMLDSLETNCSFSTLAKLIGTLRDHK